MNMTFMLSYEPINIELEVYCLPAPMRLVKSFWKRLFAKLYRELVAARPN